MKISEMITDRYKLRIPPTVYYELLADVRNEQESQTFKWCTDCREYDQEKHCCHRWSKVIRDTAKEMKQEYIERDVLDKLRDEIKQIKPSQGHFYDGVAKCLEILDKYKAESEEAKAK